VPYGGTAGRWRIRNTTIALGLSLIALPAVFLMGFWTDRIVAPVANAVPDSGKRDGPSQEMPVQDVVARDWKGELAQPFVNLPAAPDTIPAKVNVGLFDFELPKRIEEPPDVARRRRPPKPSTIAAALDADTQQFDQVVQTPAPEAVRGSSRPPDLRDPVNGFALRSPVAGQFVADIHVPRSSWFSLAAATADCESGTCQLVPVKTADRKLNTALEWSSTPQQAATQAVRDGKLVFLIHVSGNFSQPGFT
jgi:hypothetical protein